MTWKTKNCILDYMLFRSYIFIAVIVITSLQIAFFILSGQEIYPGITYPAFSKQFNIIKIEEPVICKENKFTESFVADFCIDWFLNPKYKKSTISLTLTLKETNIRVLPEEFFPYINFWQEREHFRKRMLAIGTWWWEERRETRYARQKEEFRHSIRESGKKIILQKNKSAKNSIPEKLIITFSLQGKTIAITSLPLR